MPAEIDEQRSAQAGRSEVIRVLVADGHAVLQKALVEFMDRQPDIEVCAIVDDLRDAGHWLTNEASAKVVILGWPLIDPSDAQVLAELLRVYPNARWLAVSSYDDAFSVKEAVETGIYGYVTTYMLPETICTAIRNLAQELRYFSSDVLEVLPPSFKRQIML
jgi:DNA-binding NarL/FixJ family response regulator